MHIPLDLALVVAIAVFLLAGMVKGLIGMGLPTIAMGLLAVIMPPAQAAAILIVPSFVTNVWQLVAGPAFAGLVRRLWSMMAGVIVGTITGSGVLAGNSAGIAT
ncbi:MAG: sulfite exporter TauE/SafE family protein, partial [Rhodospirillales bacterium]|nr:sulfite exporter TauE/SafE family protein [Rhodospirillales bacterium]